VTDQTILERRYRRLLALYPKAFRREREQEMLSVLMAGAGENQRWPGLAEAGDLIRSATWMRFKRSLGWEFRHRPGLWLGVRLVSGAWLVLLTLILCHYGRWWGLALLPAAALHFYLAYRLGRFLEREREAGSRAPGPPPVSG
jgi:hypothetical protein